MAGQFREPLAGSLVAFSLVERLVRRAVN